MASKESGSVSKGFIITTLVIVGIVFSFILYMRSDIYLPNDIKNMMKRVDSDDYGRELDRQRKADIADLIPIAEKGDVSAQIKLARMYLLVKDRAKAFGWATKAAASGDVRAQKHLAYYYECGIGTEENIQEAIRLYTPAAEQGDVISQADLSMIEPNKKKAEHWSNLVHKALEECPSCDLPPGGCM